MNKLFYGSAFSLAALIIILIGGGYGWVMNIVTLSHAESAMTGLNIIRIIGIFLAPLGAVLGYI